MQIARRFACYQIIFHIISPLCINFYS
jgi:hypothetical protein